MQAVLTRFLGPTNRHLESRIVVTSGSRNRRKIVDWNPRLEPHENHRRAALCVLKEWEWFGKWIGGGTDVGYAFVWMKYVKESVTVEIP
jgi:hypothetical protein